MPSLIFCAGQNLRFAEIAIQNGFGYGARLPGTVYFAPIFTDQDWKVPNRIQYMAAVEKYQPALATVLDLEREEQFSEVIDWAMEASQWVTEAVIIIPKYSGATSALPRTINGKQVRLGYSVPTNYGGTTIPTWEFEGWPIHLLGGSPQKQLRFAKSLHVDSADTNYHMGMAIKRNQFFANGQNIKIARNRWFPMLQEIGMGQIDDSPYHAFRLSCINIKAAWLQGTASLIYATVQHIDAIKKIAGKYSKELGFVNRAALMEAVSRFEIFVAIVEDQVVGFVHFHKRKDGWHTIYEIAVHPEFRDQKIGTCLLNAVPKPLRLKCTKDNSANEFYARTMKLIDEESGRLRPLNVWEARTEENKNFKYEGGVPDLFSHLKLMKSMEPRNIKKHPSQGKWQGRQLSLFDDPDAP